MKNERIRVMDLARELHVSSGELIKIAHELEINVIRAQALLSSGQVHKLRRYFENTRKHQASRPVAPLITQPKKQRDDDLQYAVCTCCEFKFQYRAFKESHELCGACREHFRQEGEPGWKTQVRLEDHVALSRAKVKDYADACASLSRDRDEAYAKRNRWMAALVEIVVAHGPDDETDGCACGAAEFPCLTRRHLRQVNKGIYGRCEDLEAMNEDEFNKVLYGTDYSFFSDWDDGVA